MAKIIVAFSDEKRRGLIASALEGAGLAVFRRCATGAEVLRALDTIGDGLVVCGARLADRTADELAYDIENHALVLVVARPERLALCEHPELFRLAAPFSAGELTAAVQMLAQLHKMRLPKRSKSENEQVAEAKQSLMLHRGMNENEAHRYLQKMSMSLGVKLAEAAQIILKERATQHDDIPAL